MSNFEPINTSPQFSSEGEGSSVTRQFFLTPERLQLIKQLQHTLEFAGSAVVEGVSGLGKTCLCRHLLSVIPADDHVRVVAVDVAQYADGSEPAFGTFLSVLCDDFGLASHAMSAGEALACLRGYVQQLCHEQRRLVLIVDNAERCADELLAALLSLAAGCSGGLGMAYLFVGLPGLAQRIDRLQLLDVSIYDFQMQPFSSAQLEAYINEQAGGHFAGFSPSTLWHKASGSPGRAQALISAAIDVDHEREQKISASAARFPLLHMVLVAVLILILLVVMWFGRDPSGEKVASRAPSVGETSSNLAVEGVQPAKPERRIVPGLAASGGGLAEPAVVKASAVAQSEAQDVPQPVARKHRVDEGVTATDSDVFATPSMTLVPSQDVAPVMSPAPSVSTVPARESLLATMSDDERFLWQQSENTYVLQIIAASRLDSLKGFVERQSNRKDIYIYRGRREGRSWYVVVVAPFASKAEAQKALGRLPEEQAHGGAWLKRMARVHDEIRERLGL